MRRVLLQLALSFPVFLFAWYWLAPLANGLLAGSVERALRVVPGVEAVGSAATFKEVLFVVRTSSLELTIEVEPRLYSWGLPLALSVLFALAQARLGRSVLMLVAASLAVAVWGIAFDVLAQILRTAPSHAASLLGPIGANLVALGYQAGSLMFPPLVPLVIACCCVRQEGHALLTGQPREYRTA